MCQIRNNDTLNQIILFRSRNVQEIEGQGEIGGGWWGHEQVRLDDFSQLRPLGHFVRANFHTQRQSVTLLKFTKQNPIPYRTI